MISLSKINVSFNKGTALEKKALKNLSLFIEDGEFVTVIGGNGAGKSTLLSTLCGNTTPDSGQIKVDETDVTSWPTWKRSGFIARVFQDPMVGSCGGLSVEENLALANRRSQKRGFSSALTSANREQFRSYLAELNLGLENRLKDPMGLLSGGQRQAISLIMATLQPIKILVLDEHTAALDPKTAHFVLEFTKKIVAERRLTTLMVTHSMQQACTTGNRTIMMVEGQIALDIKGEEKKGMTPQHFLDLFNKKHIEGPDFLLA